MIKLTRHDIPLEEGSDETVNVFFIGNSNSFLFYTVEGSSEYYATSVDSIFEETLDGFDEFTSKSVTKPYSTIEDFCNCITSI